MVYPMVRSAAFLLVLVTVPVLLAMTPASSIGAGPCKDNGTVVEFSQVPTQGTNVYYLDVRESRGNPTGGAWLYQETNGINWLQVGGVGKVSLDAEPCPTPGSDIPRDTLLL